MKKLFYLCLLAVNFSLASCAPKTSIEAVGDDHYAVSIGDTRMVIDASTGARIISCTLAGEELLTDSLLNSQNYGGTLWPSPQSVWGWPPAATFDTEPYAVEIGENSIKMTSGLDDVYPWQFTKEFSFDTQKGGILIKYSILNASNEEQTVGAWDVTRVRAEGSIIFFDAKTETIRPANVLPMKEKFDLTWFPFEESTRGRKMFANASNWLAYANGGILFVKTFPEVAIQKQAPGEAQIEIYEMQGKNYIELESQSEYKTLKPGESVVWETGWYLRPNKLALEPSEDLKAAALEIAQ